MATRVIMPKQGLQMTEGLITRWLVKEGEKVAADQPLFEMETDKLAIEIGASSSGTLLKIVRQVGETVPITELIAVIGEPGEDISAFLTEGQPAGKAAESGTAGTVQTIPAPAPAAAVPTTAIPSGPAFASPRAKLAAEENGIDYHQVTGSGPEGLIIERDVLAFKSQEQPKASPLAKKLAAINAVELADVPGTGNRGKIMKADIEGAIQARPGISDALAGLEELIPFAGMRKAIADKMMQSLHGMAQANHRMKVDMTEIIRFREKLKADGVKVSFTDILVKVVSRALLDFPIVNSTLTDAGILCKHYVNMGIAVAVENGLIVPVIKGTDQLTLPEISTAAAELIDKAKSNKLKPDDYRGGTFTITNLGMFDIDEFTAVINYPESAILAIGKIDRVPVVIGESIEIRPIMVLSLTYDHRTIDGAPAAQFLQRIKKIMQDPYLLI